MADTRRTVTKKPRFRQSMYDQAGVVLEGTLAKRGKGLGGFKNRHFQLCGRYMRYYEVSCQISCHLF